MPFRFLIAVLSISLLSACGQSGPDAAQPNSADRARVEAEPGASVEKPTGPWDGDWEILSERSSLGFSGSQSGTQFSGKFERFSARIILDPANLSAASIDVTIDMNSAKTNDRQRDSALPDQDWFAVMDYPQATFTSNEIRELSDASFEAIGTLTIRDISKPLTLPFTLAIAGDQAIAKGSASIIRTDFGVGQGEWASDQWIGLDVTINFEIIAERVVVD